MNQSGDSLLATIQNRRSVRSYNDTAIERNVLDEILAFAQGHSTGPFGNKVIFHMVDAHGFDTKSMKELGTYGAIKGARNYLVGIVKPGPNCNEDFGFCMESAILKATSLGIGTCWLGGYLNRSTFGSLCHIGDGDVIPAVTPLGYAAQRTTLRDKLIRKAVDGNNRHLYSSMFFENDFLTPLNYDETNPYHQLLLYIRLAPSASNKQPWRIILSGGNTLHLYLNEDAPYNRKYEPTRIQNIDMGIAMAHTDYAAKALGLSGKWVIRDKHPAPAAFTYIATWGE